MAPVVSRGVGKQSHGESLVTNPPTGLPRHEMRPPLVLTRLAKAREKVAPESTESTRQQKFQALPLRRLSARGGLGPGGVDFPREQRTGLDKKTGLDLDLPPVRLSL